MTILPEAPSDAKSPDPQWSGLFRLGGGTSLAIGVLLLAEFVVYSVIPDPGSVSGNLELFLKSPLLGLLSFDLLGMLAYMLFIPTILALYIELRRHSEAAMLVATALFFIGVAAFFATNTGFPMLALSDQYALATTLEERQVVLAAGQALIAIFEDSAFLVSYVIVSFSWLVISTVMLRSEVFGRLIATMGILAATAGIAAVILEHITLIDALALAIAMYFLAIVFLMLWALLTGLRLLKLGGTATRPA